LHFDAIIIHDFPDTVGDIRRKITGKKTAINCRGRLSWETGGVRMPGAHLETD